MNKIQGWLKTSKLYDQNCGRCSPAKRNCTWKTDKRYAYEQMIDYVISKEEEKLFDDKFCKTTRQVP